MAKRLPSNRKINVILLQRIKNLGDMYDTVGVAPAYARNVLLPTGVARIADAMAYNDLKGKIEKHQKVTAQYVSGVESLFAKISSEDVLTISRKANENQRLYAAVHESDIVDLIQHTYNVTIDEDHLRLPHKLDTIGQYSIIFEFKGLKKDITINIVLEKSVEKEDA